MSKSDELRAIIGAMSPWPWEDVRPFDRPRRSDLTMPKGKTIGLQTAFKRAHNLGHLFSVTNEEVSCVRCGAYVKRAAGEGIPATAALVSVPCSPSFHGWG